MPRFAKRIEDESGGRYYIVQHDYAQNRERRSKESWRTRDVTLAVSLGGFISWGPWRSLAPATVTGGRSQDA